MTSSSTNTNLQQQQKTAYLAAIAFKRPRQPNKPSRPKQTQPLGLKVSHICPVLERTFQRGVETRNSSAPLNMPHPPQSSEIQPFLLHVLPRPDIPVGGRLAHFVEQWETLTDNKWVLSIIRNDFRIPFRLAPPLLVVPISLSQISSLLLPEEIVDLLRKRAVEKLQDLGTPSFYSRLLLVSNKNGKLRQVIDLYMVNQYIRKQSFKMETVKSVRQLILVNDWAVSIDLTNAYLHVPSAIQKIPSVHLQTSRLPIHGLTIQNVPKFLDFHQTNRSALVSTCHIPVSYLDDWLMRDLIRNRQISPTIYCLLMVQSLGF